MKFKTSIKPDRHYGVDRKIYCVKLDPSVSFVKVKTALGSVKAKKVILATGAFPSLIKKVNK